MILVSVVVPVYNVESYIRQSLDSISAQTYKNIEVILVDDGSTDNSGIICDEYARIYDNFTVIHKDNNGLGMARNTGMDNSHGDYIVFLDPDDYFDKNLISQMVNYNNKKGTDTCVGSFYRVSQEGKLIGRYGNECNDVFYDEDVLHKMLPRIFGSAPDLQDGIVISSCNTLYNLEIIKKNNLRFCSEREYTSEDLFFNLDYFQHAKGVSFYNTPMYYYRINPKSLSHIYRPDRFEMKNKIYKEGCRRLKCAGIYNETKYRFMKYYFIGMKLCIRQEIPDVSGNKISICRKKIKKICESGVLKNIIRRYPVKKLGIKQRIFVYLLKYKMVCLLMVLAKLGALE